MSITMLKNALILLLAAAPAFAEGLPDFNLNAITASDLTEAGPRFNSPVERGIRAFQANFSVPDPVFEKVESGPSDRRMAAPGRAPAAPGPERYALYSEDPAADLPPPFSKSGYIQMTSSTKFKMNKEKGELTVVFPKVEFGGKAYGDRALLFVKIVRETPAPAISWATVLCSGPNFLGYKGSTVDFPEKSSSFSISETLALGGPKALITRTHPWLTGSLVALEDICSDGFLEKMKDARAETLPPRIGKFSFEFNPRKNTLKAKW